MAAPCATSGRLDACARSAVRSAAPLGGPARRSSRARVLPARAAAPVGRLWSDAGFARRAASTAAAARGGLVSASSGSKYSRVIVKLSGEALQGGEAQCSVAPAFLRSLAEQLAAASSEHGVRVGVVVGGGNHLRGADAARGGAAAGLPRPDADGAGMLGTLLNGVLLRGALEVAGADATLLSALPVPGVAAAYDRRLALKAWDEGHVLVLAAGTGNPFFTTDTAAALRAADLGADAVLKATKVDGVYDKDPVRHPDSARRFERTSFRSLLNRDLRVLDATASAFCRENKLPLVVFNVQKPGGLLAALRGDADVGTVVLPSDDVLETFEGQVDEREETQADDAAETRQTEAAL